MSKYPHLRNIPKGYRIRSFQDGDEEQYTALLNDKDLGEWTVEKVQSILENPLSSRGIYFIIWNATLIATACALDKGINNGQKTGELGWLAVAQDHRGKGLGLAVCAQVVRHLLNYNYEEIYLLTDLWRYGAIKTYLKLGFEPVQEEDDAKFKWAKLLKDLK